MLDKFRRQGLGVKFFARISKEALSNGCKKLKLNGKLKILNFHLISF